jgi:hypothetical protein
MGNTYKDRKGYPRWSNSNRLVHRDVAHAPAGSVVHHRDGDKSNFRRSNLSVMSRSEHSTLHAKKKRWF